MFTINDDLSIYATRGDTVFFTVMAEEHGTPYYFEAGDVLRIKIFEKKNAKTVVLEKSFPVTARTDRFTILLTEEDTKIGDVISKATDYWYEIELNPFTNPQTIIGYDEDGAKVFRLFPEGKDSEVVNPEPRVIAAVDNELDMTSTRPVQNQAVSRAIVNLEAAYRVTKEEVEEKAKETSETVANIGVEVAVERSRIDNIVALKEGSTTGDAELQDIRVGVVGEMYSTAGNAVRSQVNRVKNHFYNVLNGIIKPCGQQILDMNNLVQGKSIDIHTGALVSTTNEYYAITTPMVVDATLEHHLIFDVATRTYLYFFDQKVDYLGYVYKDSSCTLDNFPENTKFVKIVFIRNSETDIVTYRNIWLLEGNDRVNSDLILRDGSVSEDKCSFFVRDLLIQDAVEYNAVFNPSYGNVYESSDRSVTGYIDVTNLVCITTNFSFYIAYYDENHLFINDLAVKDRQLAGTFALPSDVRLKYVRLVLITSDREVVSGYHISNCEDSFEESNVIRKSCLPKSVNESSWYTGKKIVAYGDSITEGNKWQPYVANKLGCTMINCGIGGTTVANNGDNRTYNGVDIESWMCGDDRINLIPEDCDMIILFGGANDWSQSAIAMGDLGDGKLIDTTFKSAYSLMIKKLVNKFPNAKLVALTPINGRTSSPDANEDRQFNVRNLSLYDFSVAVKEVCMYYGVPCIDVHGESGINSFNHTTYIADVVHPNDAGGKMIANAVVNGLKRYEPIEF